MFWNLLKLLKFNNNVLMLKVFFLCVDILVHIVKHHTKNDYNLNYQCNSNSSIIQKSDCLFIKVLQIFIQKKKKNSTNFRRFVAYISNFIDYN